MGDLVMQVKVITLKENIKTEGVDVRVPFPRPNGGDKTGTEKLKVVCA